MMHPRPGRSPALYPNLYAWYVLAATLDIVVTHSILLHFGGSEVNALAASLIDRFGVIGMVALKYSTLIAVIAICEFIGRRKVALGRRLAVGAITLSALPVGVGLLQIAAWGGASGTNANLHASTNLVHLPDGSVLLPPPVSRTARRPAPFIESADGSAPTDPPPGSPVPTMLLTSW